MKIPSPGSWNSNETKFPISGHDTIPLGMFASTKYEYVLKRKLILLSKRGTKREFLLKKIFLIDVDGTICENIRNEEGQERMKNAAPIASSIKAINKLYNLGNYICFFSARTDEHEQVTREWLERHRVKYHQLILNKPRKLQPYSEYHLIDDSPVKATTFKGKFTDFVRKQIEIEVFEDD
jgi:hypothetical protein